MFVWSVIRSGRWKLMQSIKESLGLTYECWCEVWSVALSGRFAQPTRWASCIVVLASLQRRKCTTMVSHIYFPYACDKQVRLFSVCLLAVLIIFTDKDERGKSLAGQWETLKRWCWIGHLSPVFWSLITLWAYRLTVYHMTCMVQGFPSARKTSQDILLKFWLFMPAWERQSSSKWLFLVGF